MKTEMAQQFFIKISNVEVYVHPLSTSYIHREDSDFNKLYAGMLTHTKKGVDNYIFKENM
jgi:hypothetical protein